MARREAAVGALVTLYLKTFVDSAGLRTRVTGVGSAQASVAVEARCWTDRKRMHGGRWIARFCAALAHRPIAHLAGNRGDRGWRYPSKSHGGGGGDE